MLDQTEFISITEARRRLFEITKSTKTPGKVFIITQRGEPRAAMLSMAEYESWAETLEVMKEMPDLDKAIKQAEKEFKAGECITLDDLKSKMGLSKENDLPSRSGKKGQKIPKSA